MNRRDFLKIVGITTATSTAALYGCGSKEGSSEGSKVLGPIPTDKMTYIIRKTKRFAIPERAVYFLKTKRTAGGTPPPQNIFDRLTPVFT